MKRRISRSLPLLMAFAMVQMNSPLSAASLTWDSDADSANGVTDGTGTWDIVATRWFNGGTDVAWANPNNDTAVFGNGGAGGTGTNIVSLGTGITLGGLTFNTSSSTGVYDIAGGGSALTFGGATVTDLITTNTRATVSAPLAVTGSVTTLRKAGTGILELSGGGTLGRIESGPSNGSLFLTGGTFALGAINFYDTGRGNDNTTNGKVFQTGGAVTTSQDWDARNNTSSYNITGGSLTATPPNRIRGLGTFNASGDAVVSFQTNDPRIASENASGTLSINGNASFTHLSAYAPFDLANSGNAVSGTINLGGGTLTVLGIHQGSTVANGFVNFNGGTLKVSTSIQGTSFFNANARIAASVYGGGAIVDSNTKNISINQALLATSGNGLDSSTVTSGGSGYTTAPSVTFSGGGGTGATGYALIDTNGTVTSIIITNPGQNYSSAPGVIFGSVPGATSATANTTAALVNANGGFTKNGAGILTLAGANNYTGATTVNTGTLQAGVASVAGVNGAFGNNSAVNLANSPGVSLNLNGFNTQIGSLTGGGAAGGDVTANANLTTGGDNTSPAAFAGVISSNGGVIKIGTATQNLSGANTYTGSTTVGAGTLEISGTGSINTTSGVTVSAGGTFRHNSSVVNTRTITLNGDGAGSKAILAGGGTFSTAITLDNLGDTLAPGNSTGVQSFTTGQTWSSLSYDLELQDFAGATPGSSFDQIAIAGTLNLDGSAYQLNLQSLTLAGASGAVGNFSETNRAWTILTTMAPITGFDPAEWTMNTTGFTSGPSYQGVFSLATSGNDLVLSYSAIPEPSGFAVFLSGFGLLLGFHRFRHPQA